MAVVDDEDLQGWEPASAPGRTQWFLNVTGAVTSVALVLGVGVWGYKLAVRDVTGIPVVRALSGPMRIAPPDPGGEIAAHTGLSVNEVAAEGSAAPLPEKMVLAPRPVDLSPEDQPAAALAPAVTAPEAAPGAPGNATLAAAEPQAQPPATDMIVPVAPVEVLTETPLAAPEAEGTDDAMASAVETALAEALGAEPMQAESLAAVEPAPAGAVTRSPRPERRPEGDGSGEPLVVPASLTSTGAPAVPQPGEVDVASIAPGTRLVQLGAFDDEAGARAEWTRLQAEFGELMAPKVMVLQTADSAGRRFVRLRALGFEDEADARRFCSALLAENASCIPVAHRP